MEQMKNRSRNVSSPRDKKKLPLAEPPMKGSKFSSQEVETIKSRRPALIKQGKQDEEISRILSKELQRSVASIKHKIRSLIKSRELPENPNKQESKDFTLDELRTIKSRRTELFAQNKTDGEISGILSKELQRSAGSIREKIRKLIKSGELSDNPNKQVVFTKQELQIIRSRRSKLMKQGKTDGAICGTLSKELQRPEKSIAGKIHKLVKAEKLPENPNKQSNFTQKELQTLGLRRAELIKQGKQDREISRILSKEFQRSVGSIYVKIRILTNSKILPENPNKKENFTQEELQTIKSRRAELIRQGKRDHEIAGIICKDLNRSQGSIREKIRNLIKSGDLPENPNKYGRKPTEDEMFSQLVEAVDVYTGGGPDA